MDDAYVWPVIESVHDGSIEKLGKVSDGKSTIARPRRRSAFPDLLEHSGSVWFRYQ